MNKTNRRVSTTPVKTNVPAKKAIVAKEDPSLAIFKANLPCFKGTIRGNVVADSEEFKAKSGKVFDTFRIAYNRDRDNKDKTMFIKVMFDKSQGDPSDGVITKGSYVEVYGDYNDELGEYQGNPSIWRTIFAVDVKVLIEGK